MRQTDEKLMIKHMIQDSDYIHLSLVSLTHPRPAPRHAPPHLIRDSHEFNVHINLRLNLTVLLTLLLVSFSPRGSGTSPSRRTLLIRFRWSTFQIVQSGCKKVFCKLP